MPRKDSYRQQLENEYGIDAVDWAVTQVKGPFSYAFIEFLIKEQGSGSKHDILGYVIKKLHCTRCDENDHTAHDCPARLSESENVEEEV